MIAAYVPDGVTADLVVLVADGNYSAAVTGLLGRCASLGIRDVCSRVYVHPEHDPGCLGKGHELLRSFQRRFSYALVIFDRHGCGREELAREELERAVEERLRTSGWGGRGAAICVDPELECWVWSTSPRVGAALGWRSHQPELRSWLQGRGLWTAGRAKPDDPKRAVEEALREVRKARSSAIYGQLSRKVGLRACRDPAFLRLCSILTL